MSNRSDRVEGTAGALGGDLKKNPCLAPRGVALGLAAVLAAGCGSNQVQLRAAAAMAFAASAPAAPIASGPCPATPPVSAELPARDRSPRSRVKALHASVGHLESATLDPLHRTDGAILLAMADVLSSVPLAPERSRKAAQAIRHAVAMIGSSGAIEHLRRLDNALVACLGGLVRFDALSGAGLLQPLRSPDGSMGTPLWWRAHRAVARINVYLPLDKQVEDLHGAVKAVASAVDGWAEGALVLAVRASGRVRRYGAAAPMFP